MSLARIARTLAETVDALAFAPPVAWVYDPFVYARKAFETYARRYGKGPKEVLLVGMNPGPWGMAQTGIPFGDVGMVRDWMGIRSGVTPPAAQHPKRPVLGFACPRREVSGTRLWNWAAARCGTPERFFARCWVWNYCPLAFLEGGGRNRTPDKLPAAEREPLFEACDAALRAVVRHLAPRWTLGVGAFAETRLRRALGPDAIPQIGRILHPSPASPLANRGWAERVDAELEALGIQLP